MPRPLRVALLIETSRVYARGLIDGVARYVREQGPWSIYFRPHGLDDPLPDWLPDWEGDGILVRVQTRRMARAVLETGLPAIDLRGVLDDLPLPFIGVDNRAVAEMAAEHLLNRGFRQFGVCGPKLGQMRWMDRRCDDFEDIIEEAGFTCDKFAPREESGRPLTWEHEQQQLVRWLRKLPRPVGIMAANDDIGQQLLDACLRASIAVPDEVAVISVDNDPQLCAVSNPTLSSIQVDPQRTGYEAAALLDRMMAGAPVPREPIFIPPRRVVTRRSTDVIAVEDELASAAARFIRNHACEGVNVEQVLDHLGVSRSNLERRMRQAFGRSPKAEIDRVRLEQVCQLLATTNLSLEAIAERSGFTYFHHMATIFRRRFGETPGAYRRRCQAELAPR